jgi:hypothetical protein
MVEHVIRTVDASVSFKGVTAARGKIAGQSPLRRFISRVKSGTLATSQSWKIKCQL